MSGHAEDQTIGEELGPPAIPDGDGVQVDIAKQGLARPAALMAVGTTLSRATGLGRTIAMAFALGVAESRLADAYNLANTLPNVIYELLLGGILTSVFIPVLVEQLRKREHDDAWKAVSAMVTTALTVLVVMTGIVVLAAPLIIDFFTLQVPASQRAAQQDLATFFLIVFAPQVVFYGIAAIGQSLLNAHGKFGVPMFLPIVNNVIVIATFLLFAFLTMGTPTDQSVFEVAWQRWLLGAGTTAGIAVMALIYIPFLRRLPGKIRFNLNFRHPAVLKLGKLAFWSVIYVFVNAIGFSVSFYLAGGVQGGVTAYATAFAFFQLPIGIAAVSIMTALVPKLSAHHVDGDNAAFLDRLADGVRLTSLLMLPATAGLIVLAQPMIQFLLEHGIVGADSVSLVSSVLVYFAVGLLPFAIWQLQIQACYTRQDARTPALLNVWHNVATIALDFLLYPAMGIEGLALAHSLGYVAGVIVAAVVLRRQIGSLTGRRIASEMSRVIAASAFCAAAIFGVMAVVAQFTSPGEWRSLLDLILGAAVGLAVFLGAARLFGVHDLSMFKRILPGKS